MGIQRIESVTYGIDDLATCARFFEDFGLFPALRTDGHAVFETRTGQTLHLDSAPDGRLPPPVEPGPTLREIVWGVDTPDELARLVAAVSTDRPVAESADGVHHTVDETGFGVGLTLARPRPAKATPRPANTHGHVARWNEPLEPLHRAHPLRMCHVALNIPEDGRREAVAFYTDRLGFRPTDVVEPMGVFLRAPGDDDQHTMLLCHRPDRAGVNHIAYEVPGFDDVVEGGNHMIERGWREARRLGRHTIGSNVFRFLHAPCGGRVEYAADMDRVDDRWETRVHETTPPHHIWALRGNRDPQDSPAAP
ncbi:VOC family protein [Streptomyces griseoviridis]|uniref:VOC family protein n=1 Tax=Streptomyces TaxID=1883 RepID=UPI00247310AD|nr:VOC family protein [Streptomyces sp. MAA16]MDH6696509.1 catechol 2,3-dioxygenase-like lactoylglutathione lyase family enzyme [Streptomyces sp. MAA16]